MNRLRSLCQGRAEDIFEAHTDNLTTCKISSPQTVSVFFAVVLFFAVFRSIKSRAN